MNDLRDVMIERIQRKMSDGSITKIVDDHVDKFVGEVAKDALSSWGDVAKAFKARATEGLLAKIGNISMEEYNSFIIDEMKKRLDTVYIASAKKNMVELMDEMFKKPREGYSLTDLVSDFVKANERECDTERCTALLIKSEYGWYDIYLDAGEDVEKSKCMYNIVVHKEGTVSSVRTRESWGKDYAELKPNVNYGLNGFESILFQIKSNGSKLVMDVDKWEESPYYPDRRD